MTKTARWFLLLAPALLLGGCGGDADADETEQPGDPRIEAVRDRADEADSLMRVRMRDVEEASRQQ